MRMLPLLLMMAMFVGMFLVFKDILTKFQRREFLKGFLTAVCAVIFAGTMIALMLAVPHQL